ncbi:MAG: UDP-N-acetylmuramoyl-L-alanyl-D-glutamate--2,6-diaminopimelate ligase [Gammaproteobacteria bacterium]
MVPEQRVQPDHRLAALLDGVATVATAQDVPITGLCLRAQDTRPGDLFVALAGLRTHGLRYLEQALARGAAAVVWEPASGIAPPTAARTPVVAVESLARRLGLVADRFFGHPSRALTTIAVTGTDGKTSVSHFLAQALDKQPGGPHCGLIGTLGYGLYGHLSPGVHTTPDAIRLHRELAILRVQGAVAAVMEASSHALAQYRLDGVALDAAILTNVTRDHLDYHQDAAAYAVAKRRLFEMPGLRHAVLNTDDALGIELVGALSPAVNTIGYGIGEAKLPGARCVRATEIEATRAGLRFAVYTPKGRGVVQSRLLGRFNVSNLLAVLAALLALDMPLPQALARINQTRGAPGRMQAHGGNGRPLVVVDYAHTPAALAHALIALREHCGGRLWCVFGCGGDRDAGKRPLMARVAQRHADEIIVTDDNPRGESPAGITADILAGFSRPDGVRVIHDRADAIACAVSAARAGDVVLVAGKGHEQVQIIGAEQRPFSDSQTVTALLGERRL